MADGEPTPQSRLLVAVACVALFQSACVDYVPFRPQDPPGDSSVVVTLKNGDVERFDPPVVVDRDGEILVFHGAARQPLRVSESDVAKVEASKAIVTGATWGAIGVVAVILGFVTWLVAPVVSSTWSPASQKAHGFRC